jgi:hypothetical protein
MGAGRARNGELRLLYPVSHIVHRVPLIFTSPLGAWWLFYLVNPLIKKILTQTKKTIQTSQTFKPSSKIFSIFIKVKDD